MLSDTVEVALIASLAPTLLGIAGLVVALKTHAKAQVIETTTDGNLSRVTNSLAVANETIRGLTSNAASLADAKSKDDLKAANLAGKPTTNQTR